MLKETYMKAYFRSLTSNEYFWVESCELLLPFTGVWHYGYLFDAFYLIGYMRAWKRTILFKASFRGM